MSDDGYYPGSAYDDLDDLYYEDDLGDNLPDDLAEHTMPSPIYHEDPAYEMLEYFSDWEYYSDDYYDDDPALLKKNPQSGADTKSKRDTKTDTQAKGKKRKLTDTKDIPELALDDRPTLAASVRGTVWRGPRPQSPKPYEIGKGPRIALLKNWAQIFERTSLRSMLKRDESWANDLSLEDMGLRKVESTPAQDAGAPVEDDLEEGNEGEMEEDGLDQIDGSVDKMQMNGDTMDPDDIEETKPNKRPRIVAPMPSPPPSHNSGSQSNTSTETIVQDMKTTTMASVDGHEPPDPSRGRPKKKVYPDLAQPQKAEVAETSVKTRKRKASPDPKPSDDPATKSTASTRAKRVASSKLTTIKGEKPPPVAAARATRSRKK
jgi:hypothetical protein